MTWRKCEICGIRERYTENLVFAKFPLREHVCKQWVKVVGNEDLVYLPIEKLHQLRYVCGKHFTKRDFTKSKKRLKKHAIPTLDLRCPPLPEELLEGFPLHMARSREVIKYEGQHLFNDAKEDKEVERSTDEGQHPFDDAEVDKEVERSTAEDEPQSEQGGQFSWEQDNAVVPCDDDAERAFPPAAPRASPPLDRTEYLCNFCSKIITGFRYTCVQCLDVDLCGACEAQQAHATHYVLRIPGPRPLAEVAARLRTIRRALLADAIINVPMDLDDAELEVKEEPNPDREVEMSLEDPIDVEPVPTDIDQDDPLVMESDQRKLDESGQEDSVEQSASDDDGASVSDVNCSSLGSPLVEQTDSQSESAEFKPPPDTRPPLTQATPLPQTFPVFQARKVISINPQQRFTIPTKKLTSSVEKPVLRLRLTPALNANDTMLKLKGLKPIILKNKNVQKAKLLRMLGKWQKTEKVEITSPPAMLTTENKRLPELPLPATHEVKRIDFIPFNIAEKTTAPVVRLQRMRAAEVAAALRPRADRGDCADHTTHNIVELS